MIQINNLLKGFIQKQRTRGQPQQHNNSSYVFKLLLYTAEINKILLQLYLQRTLYGIYNWNLPCKKSKKWKNFLQKICKTYFLDFFSEN